MYFLQHEQSVIHRESVLKLEVMKQSTVAAQLSSQAKGDRPTGSKFEMVQPYYSAMRSRMLLLSNCFFGHFEAVVAES